MLTTDQKGAIAEAAIAAAVKLAIGVVRPVAPERYDELRLPPARNNQRRQVHWASSFELAARLETRWGRSSAGRAFGWQPKGHGFEPRRLHSTPIVVATGTWRRSGDTSGKRHERTCPIRTVRSPPVRLLVARCSVRYTGRLSAFLPEATRLVILKADGSVLVHADAGGYKPLNWMTPPTALEPEGDPLERLVVRKRAGRSEDRLEIEIAELLSDVEHEMGEPAPLEKDGVERDLQEALAARPAALGPGLRLVRREWPTDVGPVDLMCRDGDGGWVAVEVKRVATVEAVEQLARYLERIRLDPAKAGCAGILAAERIGPQAATLAAARGLACAEVDLAALRGEREPELTLFAP